MMPLWKGPLWRRTGSGDSLMNFIHFCLRWWKSFFAFPIDKRILVQSNLVLETWLFFRDVVSRVIFQSRENAASFKGVRRTLQVVNLRLRNTRSLICIPGFERPGGIRKVWNPSLNSFPFSKLRLFKLIANVNIRVKAHFIWIFITSRRLQPFLRLPPQANWKKFPLC